MKNIEKKIIKIISKQLSLTKTEINKTSSLLEDLGADSLDRVELIMTLEDTFNVEIQDEEAENFTTIDSICTFIKNKIS
ncbi:MAG: acyl carrier protein [Buchnera aphidicola (Schlechtendalia peitan)]